MELYYDICRAAVLITEVCKICICVLSARLILLISRWVKEAYKERNVWEPEDNE